MFLTEHINGYFLVPSKHEFNSKVSPKRSDSVSCSDISCLCFTHPIFNVVSLTSTTSAVKIFSLK